MSCYSNCYSHVNHLLINSMYYRLYLLLRYFKFKNYFSNYTASFSSNFVNLAPCMKIQNSFFPLKKLEPLQFLVCFLLLTQPLSYLRFLPMQSSIHFIAVTVFYLNITTVSVDKFYCFY